MPRPPTRELGVVSDRLPLWGSWAEADGEYVPALRWPRSLDTYDRMRRDAQIAGLLLGLTLPIRQWDWRVDPNGAPDDVVEKVCADFGLPAVDEPKNIVPRRSGRFQWDRHLQEVLKSLVFGHSVFEIVGEIIDGEWRLRKLAPRPQKTITRFEIEDDGGLAAVHQQSGPDDIRIPINRMVVYVWDQDPGIWTGNSVLRPLYRNWLIKDRLVRVDAVGHENRDLGTPVIEPPDGVTQAQMDALQQTADALRDDGADFAGVVPPGTKLTMLNGRPGGGSTIESVRYHDEQMARSLLMMFMQLGQTQTGSRALAGSMIDYLAAAQRAIGEWIAEVTTEHVIEDWVSWNSGDDVQAPRLTWAEPETETLNPFHLRALIDGGIIQVDDELEEWIRSNRGLPEKGTPRVLNPAYLPDRSGRSVEAALRRRLTPDEQASKADFERIGDDLDAQHLQATDEWEQVQREVLDQLAEQVEELDTDDPTALDTLSVPPAGVDVIYRHLVEARDRGMQQAVDEARRQGVTSDPVLFTDDDDKALRQAAEAYAKTLTDVIVSQVRTQLLPVFGPDVQASRYTARGAAALVKALSPLKTFPADQLLGALNGAEFDGRAKFYDHANANLDVSMRWVATEILDENTCELCAQVDGALYSSLADALQDYPNGQYIGCLGGTRCRGRVVAIYSTEEP